MAVETGVEAARPASHMWPEGAPPAQVDQFILLTLEREFPAPQYLFELDRHRPRIMQVSRWKVIPNRYRNDQIRHVGRPKDIDIAVLEKAGAGWLELARKAVG